MMKIERRFHFFILFLLLTFSQSVRAQEESAVQQTITYQMQLVRVMDEGERPEYLFVLGPLGFKSVEGLKNFIVLLPAGSRLEWSPGCIRWGDEPLLSSADDLEEFKRFCAEHGVEFILHPSG